MSERRPDIAANRQSVKWTARELFGRLLWDLAQPFFSLSPRQLWGWRNGLLRVFGARIGRAVHIYPTVRIIVPWNLDIGDHSAIGDRAILYALGRIVIGAGVTISQHAHLCAGTHDYRRADLPLQKSPIAVEDGVWICADAFVGPGRKVGAHAIVAARAVVTQDVPAAMIVGGNPARAIAPRPKFDPT